MAGRRPVTPQVHRYRLRGSGLTLHLRQPWWDIWVFDEIFRRRVYRLPEPALQALRDLGRPIDIVDLGGHVGMASLSFLESFPDASITAFEPEPDNARLLRETIVANGRGESWQLVEACAGTCEDTVEFVQGTGEMSHVGARAGGEPLGTMPPEARSAAEFPDLGGSSTRLPMKDVFPYLAQVDLLKIDIEGGEWDLLADPRFADVPARALVLEFHSFFGPEDPAGEIVRILEGTGYEVGPFIEPRPELGEGELWAWRA